MQLPDSIRAAISGRARSIVALDGSAHRSHEASPPAVAGENSGSRVQLGRSFRRVTLVGVHESSLRRNGTLNRPI